MQANRILVVVKRTKWERDRVRYGSARTAKKIYARQNQAFDRVFQSHERQIENLERLRAALPDARYVQREELPYSEGDSFDLIVSCGGDNHFVYVSHYARGKPILGLNSDPESSTGALLYFGPDRLIAKVDALLSQQVQLEIEEWTRIASEIELPDGRKLRPPACISEISVRSTFHDYISRYLIGTGPTLPASDAWEEHKNSGLLLACGAGSTGWYRNCQPLSQQSKAAFPKDAEFFKGIAREVSARARRRYGFIHPKVHAGESMFVISEMDGEITIDAEPERVFDFPPGAMARFWLSEDRLKVVKGIG